MIAPIDPPHLPELVRSDATLHSFDELTQKVAGLMVNQPERRVWKALYEKGPLDEKALTDMHDLGWKVELYKGIMCWCDEMRDLTIKMPKDYRGYQRDKALFHMLMPPHFGTWISVAEDQDDGTPNIFSDDNRAIVEWLARRARANPQL